MRVVSPTDLRKRLGEILDAASAGERILIERDHKPLAYLVSVEIGERVDETAAELRRRRLTALDRAEAFARRMSAAHPDSPGWVDVATAVRRDRDRDAAGT